MAGDAYSCKIIYEPGWYKKVAADWPDVISDTLDTLCLQAEKYCKEKGVGVKDGASPSGGAPYDTGTLRRGHSSDLGNKQEKYVRNSVEYWMYVVYGTSKMNPNDYPSRVRQRLDQEKFSQKALATALKKHGIVG